MEWCYISTLLLPQNYTEMSDQPHVPADLPQRIEIETPHPFTSFILRFLRVLCTSISCLRFRQAGPSRPAVTAIV